VSAADGSEPDPDDHGGPGIAAGEAFARAMMPAIRICVDNAMSPAQFWAGFVTGVAGMAIADLGGYTAAALLETAARVAKQIAAERDGRVN
jgi:hypothetical protein